MVPLRPGTDAVNTDITHLYLVCEERDKLKLLRQVISAMKPERALVFAHGNDLAERATSQLDYHHIKTVELHADFDKLDRKQAMDDFRAGRPVARKVVARKAPADANLERLHEVVGNQLDAFFDPAEQGWGKTQKYPISAPIERANCSFSAEISMAMTLAPKAAAIIIADRPTPPQPWNRCPQGDFRLQPSINQ